MTVRLIILILIKKHYTQQHTRHKPFRKIPPSEYLKSMQDRILYSVLLLDRNNKLTEDPITRIEKLYTMISLDTGAIYAPMLSSRSQA